MRFQDLIHRLMFKMHHISDYPKANLTGCFLNLAQRGLRPLRALDVGANKGKWSRDLRSVFPDCQCLLLEPQLEMKSYLDRFCRRNPGCQWICAGAGETIGELPFTLCPDTVSSSFQISPAVAAAAGYQRRVVPVTTLDHVCQEYFQGAAPDIVKIDAEGFESQILRGARSLLGKTELFFLETHFFADPSEPSSMVNLTSAMGEYGYSPYDFTWFGKRPYDGAIGLCEVAFARRQGTLRSFQGWSQPAAAAA